MWLEKKTEFYLLSYGCDNKTMTNTNSFGFEPYSNMKLNLNQFLDYDDYCV